MMREKTPLLDKFVCFPIGTKDLVRNYLFFKNYVTSEEAFPTMFYTINSSPMLVTKSVFKLIFVLRNYQNVYLPFNRKYYFIINMCKTCFHLCFAEVKLFTLVCNESTVKCRFVKTLQLSVDS